MSEDLFGHRGVHRGRGGRGQGRGGQGRGGQGRGGRGRGGYFSQRTSGPPDRTLMEGLHAEPVAIVERPANITDDEIAIEELEYLSSYSWVSAKKPTVVIPGSPAYWHDRPLPYTVPSDS